MGIERSLRHPSFYARDVSDPEYPPRCLMLPIWSLSAQKAHLNVGVLAPVSLDSYVICIWELEVSFKYEQKRG